MIGFFIMVLMIGYGYFYTYPLFINASIPIGTRVAGELKNVKRKYEA